MTQTARRVLLDECLPRRLKRELPRIRRFRCYCRRMGRSPQRRQLLRLMREAGFDVFVTVDRNLVYQQNIATAGVAVLVLHARSNRIAVLRPFAPALLTAIAEAQVGTVTHIGV